MSELYAIFHADSVLITKGIFFNAATSQIPVILEYNIQNWKLLNWFINNKMEKAYSLKGCAINE